MLKGRPFQARLFIEQAVIKFQGDGAQGAIQISQICDPTDGIEGWAPNASLHLERVAVHPRIGPVLGAIHEVVGCIKIRGLSNFEGRLGHAAGRDRAYGIPRYL